MVDVNGTTYVYTTDDVPIIVKERVDEIMAKLEEDGKKKCHMCKHKYDVKSNFKSGFPCRVCSEQYASKFERE